MAKKKLTLAQRLDRTLYNPGKVLGGKNLRSTVDQLVRMQIKPQVDAIDTQRAATERQRGVVTQNAQSYLDTIAQRQADLVKQSQGITANANAAQGGIAAQAKQAMMQAAQGTQQRTDDDAMVRGDIAKGAADQLAKAYADRMAGSAARSTADAGAVAARGGSSDQLAVSQAMASNQRGGEQLGSLANRFASTLGDLDTKKRDVESMAGSIRADALTKLRQQQFDNLITERGLGLKEKDLEIGALTDQARIDETSRHNKKMESKAQRAAMLANGRFKLDQEKYGFSVAKDNYQRTHSLGPYKPAAVKGTGLTPAQKDRREQGSIKFWEGIDNVNAAIDGVVKNLVAAKKAGKLKQPINDQLISQVLGDKYSQLQLRVAMQLRPSHGGKLPPDLVQKLRAKHIDVADAKRARPRGAGPAFDLGALVGAVLD